MVKPSDLGRTRTRELGTDHPAIGGTQRFYLNGVLYQTTQLGGSRPVGLETTRDATHPWFVVFERNQKEGNFRFFNAAAKNALFRYILKTGGEFSSSKRLYRPAVGRKVHLDTGGSNRVTYDGWVLPCSLGTTTNVSNPISDASLKAIGARQVLYNLPTKPLADIGQTIAELKREGLPRLRSLSSFKSYTARKSGEDYLSWQFGFRPVIQDIYALASSIDTADKQWRAYVKGGNTLQRRHFTLPVDQSNSTTAVSLGGTIYPNLGTTLASGASSQLYRERSITSVTRFSAAYAYTVPKLDKRVSALARKALQYRRQYGLEIDPELLWNLTPWSWLIDWFLPIGDYVSAVNNLVLGNTALPWAYVSTSYRVSDTYFRPGCRLIDGEGPGKLEVVTHYQRRVSISPFGNAESWTALSAKQLSILAAIGITR